MARNSNYHDDSIEEQCYFCECGPPLEEHHIIPRRFDGPDTKENIVEVCQLCHRRLERLYDKSFYEFLGITDESGERQFHRQCNSDDCNNQAAVKTRKLEGIGFQDPTIERVSLISTTPGGLYCRPCAAKMAAQAYESWETEYWKERLKQHEQAREDWDSDRRKSSRYPLRFVKPQSPEWIYEEMVVKEVD